jgi:hypothetical protein
MTGQDRAAAIATAILQIVEEALRSALRGESSDARAAVEATLRDEFADLAQTVINETRPDQGDD